MDRPADRPPAADEHWAPEFLVLERHPLSHAGRLLVERDAEGHVVVHSPLADMAAVEHRFPAWAMGPFGRLEPERPLPEAAGVFALVDAGAVQYVGSSDNIARLFGQRHGLGEISRQDAQRPRWEERCRLNRLVVAAARAGRTIDLYLLLGQPRRSLLRPLTRTGVEPAAIAEEITRTVRGPWHLPT